MVRFKSFIPEEFSSIKNKKNQNTRKKTLSKQENNTTTPITMTHNHLMQSKFDTNQEKKIEENLPQKNNIQEKKIEEEIVTKESIAAQKNKTFSTEELNIAKAISYQEGYDKAIEEYKNNTKHKFIEQLHVLIQNIQKNIDQKNFHLSALTVHTGDLLISLFRKSLPFFIEKYGTEEIIAFLNNTLPNLQDEDELTFLFSDTHKESLEELIPDLLKRNGYHGKYILLFKKNLDPMYIEIIWKFGNLKIDPDLFNIGVEKALSYLKNNNNQIEKNEQTITWSTNENSNEVAP